MSIKKKKTQNQKQNSMKNLILVLVFLSSFNSLYSPITKNKGFISDIEQSFVTSEKNRLFELVIEEIKKAESLKLNLYKCPAGQNTIGYGHMLRKSEGFTSITKQQAEQLLIQDFYEVYNYLDKSLSYPKRLAIAKFCFNIGIGKYNKSKLKKYVDNKQPIDNIIVQYCYYKKNGKYVQSSWLLKQRKFELNIYNYEDKIGKL